MSACRKAAINTHALLSRRFFAVMVLVGMVSASVGSDMGVPLAVLLVLTVVGALRMAKGTRGRDKVGGLALYVVLMLALDLPLARLEYHRALGSVSKSKARLGTGPESGMCRLKQGARPGEGGCNGYCYDVRRLAETRQAALQTARERHMVAAAASSLFDTSRSMDQSAKIRSLFEKRTCARVLRSVDKTNSLVDAICMALFLIIAVITLRLQGVPGQLAGDDLRSMVTTDVSNKND